MISKLLLGVTGQRNSRTRAIVHALNEQLNLIHINMRQPFIDVLAVVTGNTPQVAATLDREAIIPALKCKAHVFEREYSSALFCLNKDYFTEIAAEKITRSTAGFTDITKNIFDGFIVSGISTTHEAKFIRDRGGVMLHLQDGPGFTDFHPLETRLYDVIFDVKKFDPQNKESIDFLIAHVKESHKRAA